MRTTTTESPFLECRRPERGILLLLVLLASGCFGSDPPCAAPEHSDVLLDELSDPLPGMDESPRQLYEELVNLQSATVVDGCEGRGSPHAAALMIASLPTHSDYRSYEGESCGQPEVWIPTSVRVQLADTPSASFLAEGSVGIGADIFDESATTWEEVQIEDAFIATVYSGPSTPAPVERAVLSINTPMNPPRLAATLTVFFEDGASVCMAKIVSNR